MHCQIALFVTGRGEAEFLPALFRSLTGRADCSFVVQRRIGQRSPIVSPKKQLRMTGAGKVIPDKDAEEIGLPARRFLKDRPDHFVLVIDDIEGHRRRDLTSVFRRYRLALDAVLALEERERAAVHFFVNMLEAYYFADSEAVNSGLGATILTADYTGDVEDIPHPKNELKRLHQGFDEVKHGAAIVQRLDLDRILNDPSTCAHLRSLFACCVNWLHAYAGAWDSQFAGRYQLPTGRHAELTKHQSCESASTGATSTLPDAVRSSSNAR